MSWSLRRRASHSVLVRLFTLSAIYQATSELIADLPETDTSETAMIALEFWEACAENLDEWEKVRQGTLTAGEVRADFIHTHAVVLQALARVGRALLKTHPDNWKDRIGRLNGIDWRRANSQLWEGRALVGGRLSKAHQQVMLTANAIKTRLGLTADGDEQEVEDAFNRGNGAREGADGQIRI